MSAWQVVRIDLNKRQVSSEPIPDGWKASGGRDLISLILSDEMDAGIDALSSENPLVLSTGLLAGSGASSSTRLSVGAKSPLTGGIKESNVGGKAGQAFGKLGIRSMIIRGQSPTEWIYLYLNAEGVEIRSGGDLLGLNLYETVSCLQERHGKSVAVMAIGPAGEMGLSAASIGVGDLEGIPARRAGRGGMGAVMGSKRIKAIVIDAKGTKAPTPADPAALKAAVKRFTQALLQNHTTAEVMPKFGTSVILKIMNDIGGLPTRNFSLGSFEGADKIDAQALFNLITERKGKPTHACMPGCIVRCSNVIPDKEEGELTRALEYESLTLLGANCGIDDLDVIGKLNRRCDEIGLDTIETGDAIAVAMEAGLAEFGDAEAALAMVEEINQGTVMGRLLGNGTALTGKILGVKRVPVVQGQSLAAYDPRTTQGTGVTYATSPMGADHTAGNILPGSKLQDGTMPDLTDLDGQVELSRFMQKACMILDSVGLCIFTRAPIFEDPSLLTDMLKAYVGIETTFDELLESAQASLDREQAFNKQAGVNMDRDLPPFFRNEPLPPTGNLFRIKKDKLNSLVSAD